LGSFAFSHLQASDSLLIEAVFAGDMEEVRQLLTDGANPNETDDLGNTPLHSADTPEMVDLLCENGANINQQNKYGDTPLHVTMQRVFLRYFYSQKDSSSCLAIAQACMRILFKYGANTKIKNKEGNTALSIIQRAIKRNIERGPVLIFGNKLRTISDEDKANYKKIQEELLKFSLSRAIADGDEEEMRQLIAAGANL
jgi:ankyrin repeat protein